MVLGTPLLNTKPYKVRKKGKVRQSKEISSALLGEVAIEKGAFGLPSTKVNIFTFAAFLCNCRLALSPTVWLESM